MLKLEFGDKSIMVLAQKYQKCNPVITELSIHKISEENQEYWLIPNFPQAKFVFVCTGEILDFIKIAPEITLDHLSVIYYLMILEASFKNQTEEEKRQKLSRSIRFVENWLSGALIGRNDQALFLLNKEKIKKEGKVIPIVKEIFPGAIGVSTHDKLPDKIYKALYDEMFVVSL